MKQVWTGRPARGPRPVGEYLPLAMARVIAPQRAAAAPDVMGGVSALDAPLLFPKNV